MELKRILLLLPSAALLVELSIQSDPPAGLPKARNVLKLCGNKLRRAIVFACGVSRWKREEMDPPLPESDQTSSNKVIENVKLQSTSDPELKQQQGDGPLAEEPSWTDFIEYYIDDKNSIPAVKDDPAWNSAYLENDPELKQVQRDHPPDTEPSWTDFLDVYNDEDKEYTAAGAEGGRQESPDEKGLGNPTASESPQAKVKRKRDRQWEMAVKCCFKGCTDREIDAAFCSE